jgi:hypothetical protein
MKIGTKTLLFGSHQFVIHPILVFIAWVKLYKKLPNFKELICIIIHDWGYWGKPNLDGPEGEKHPIWAAMWIAGNTDWSLDYSWLCLYHSRFMAKMDNHPVSKLCLPDKYGVALAPAWLWVFLGNLTGEIKEYRAQTNYEISNAGPCQGQYKSSFEFFRAYKAKCAEWVKTGDLTIRTENTLPGVDTQKKSAHD